MRRNLEGGCILDIISVILLFVPILVVLVFANVGQRNREHGQPAGAPAFIAYGLLIIMYGAGIMIGLVLQSVGFLAASRPELLQEAMGAGDGAELFSNLPLFAAGVWIPSLLGIILLIRPVRLLIAQVTPIDPDSPIDAVALSLSMLVLINLFVTLGIGLDTLADLMDAGQTEGPSVTILSMWAQQLMMALTAVIGVGWLTRKSWRGMLERLDIVMPTARQAVTGFFIGLALVPVVAIMEYLASLVGVRTDQNVARLTEELLGALLDSPWGIVTLGLAAALGEEPLFRGAAQPRFGLILTSLLFALLHSNYGISLSTGVVLILGIVLGVVRIRHNTSTAMIVHAVYNITLGLIAYFSLPFFQS